MAGTDIGTNFAGGLAVNIVTAIGKQARYCYEFNKLITDLGDGQENLISTRDDMQRQFDKDRANSKEPPGDLERQLKAANELIGKVDKLKEKARAEQSCCHGVCPNWICRYFVGKEAEEKVKAIKELNDELRRKLLSAHRLSLRCVRPSEDFFLFKCTAKARHEILKALRDDKKIRIGLCGMAGCGKTSLLKKVHKEVEDSKLYKTAFAIVSNPPNYIAIQDSIANWIGLVFETEKNVEDRAARLSTAFEEHKKYLIILDNVWQVLDFEVIGIPVGENCKVLLSTRKRQIFDWMGFDAKIDLSVLTDEEAWELFQKLIGEIKDPFQKEVARKIADECYGLPVAIKAMARTLRCKGHHVWINALTTLKDHTQPLKIDEEGLDDPYRCLKYSFDELKDPKEVSLFILCALLPNDFEIAIEVLIRFAFGLGIFKDINSYQRARSKVRTIIDKFRDYCLLVQEGEYVKLHDMFHALALWEAKKKTQVIMGPEQIVELTKEVYMKDTDRLYCHGIEDFPDQLSCPELEILIVSNNGGCSSKFPHVFFEEMMKLKVLAIKNTSIGTKPDLVLPQSMEGLKKLRTLCLRGWTLINISMFEKLEMLHSIELLDCVMEELPTELANMKALKLLEVSNCKIGGDPYKVLATCSHLEELYFVDNDFPETVRLIGQNVQFFSLIGSFKVLQRYHLGIGGSINTSKYHSSSKLISINNFDASSITNEAFQALSQTLEVLFFEKIQGDCKSIIPDMFPIQGECLNELKEFVLHDSDCIKYLIDTTNHRLHQTGILFTKLQKLKVEAMKSLEALCHGPPPSGLFDNLKELFITNCNQLASLFTTTTAQKMVMLEVLEVIDCGNLRYVVKIENENEDILVGPMLPSLKQISVKRCKSLKCVLPISVASGLLQLETLEIEDAAELQYVFGYCSNEKDQNQKQIHIDFSAVKLKLINLPVISSICPQYKDMKQPLDKPVVTGCPRLSDIFGLDSQIKQEDGDEAMEQAEMLSMWSGEDLRFNTRVRNAKDLVQATAQQARYFFRFNTFVTDLSKEKNLLISKLEAIPFPAEPSGDPQQHVIVANARHLMEEVETLERKAEASKSCCHGVFPNLLGRYIIGKRVERMTKIMKQFNERLLVKPHRVLSQPRITSHDSFCMVESTEKSYNEILVALEDDEIYMIGLYGLGGGGKTSLIKEVGHKVISWKLFDMVVFVPVSNDRDIRRIQGDIARQLGLAFNSDGSENETQIAATLSMKLNKGDKFLIILDDIWQVLKLEDVGIPLGKNCKVVLTTRHQHLCSMMGCQKMVYFSPLSEQESLILFQHHVGVTQGTLKDIALQILRKCGGLPLAITTVAKALKDKPLDDWEHVLRRLENPLRRVKSNLDDVGNILKFSIDNLGDEARSLFFLCALVEEDSNIAREILIRFAIGLGIFKDIDTYERARTQVGAAIDKMINRNLLLAQRDQTRQHFCIHNVFRDVALTLTKKIQVFIGPEENLTALTERAYMKDTRRLYCLDINEYPNQLNCPILEFLLVSNDSGCPSKFSNDFFIEIIELKVLGIIDTSIWTTPILLLPQSMGGLKKLRTVCLRGWTLNNISILGVLKTLETIELLYCVIKELPEELVELTRLRLLEVSGCKIGSDPFEVLSRCSQLEELYFVENSLPEMLSNDHDIVKLLHQIGSSKTLQRYHLQIGSSIDSFENYLVTKFISINGFNIPTSNEEMKTVAQKLEVLFLENVQGDCKNIFPHMIPIDGECMNGLTKFLLHDSDLIECLIDTTNHYQTTTTIFSKLQKLKIKNMKCFKALCYGLPPFNLFEKLEELFIVGCIQLQCIDPVGNLNFCRLKHLKLEDCPKLTSAFTYSTAQTTVSLEILKVRDCISLKQIIEDEEEDEITPVGPIFPKLKQVFVNGCPHLKFIIPASVHGGLPQLSIISDSEVAIQQGGGKSREQELESDRVVQSVEDIHAGESKIEGIFQLTKPEIDMESKSLLLSCLQSLVMENLPNLRYISEGHEQLLNLRRVKIYKCGELKCIFSLCMMTYISALRELIIEDCSQLKQIFEQDYYDGHYTGPFSEKCNLQKIIIKSCPKLGSLFTVLIAKTLRLMMTLKIEDCPRMRVLLKDGSTEAYKRKEIIEEVGGQAIFPNLSFLSLKNLPELIHACEGGELKAVKGVMFPESFNLSNLQSLTLQSCPRLRSLFTVATAKTLMWLTSLEIIECSGLECVIRGKSKKIAQRDLEEMLPKLNILHLVKLPSLIITHRGIKLQCELCHIQDCPKLKQTLAGVLKLDDLPQEYESSEEEDYHDDDGKDMDRREEQHKEVKSAILEDDSNVYGQKSFKSCQEIKELDEADVDSLSPTMASSSSEVVAIHQNKEVPSHTGLTRSNEDRGKEIQRGNNDIPRGSIAAGSNFHLLKKDGTDLLYEVQAAEEVHPHTQEGLQKQKFCPVDLMNLHESSTKIRKGSLHKDTGREESKVGTSTQELIDKKPEVEIDGNVAKVQDTTEVHPQLKEFVVIADTQEGLQQQNSCSFGATNSTEVLIEKQPQIVLDPQQALQEHKASLPLPGQSAMTSPSSTCVSNTSPTSEAQVSSSKHQHQIAEDEALVKATGSHIHLMKQDGTSDPHQGMLPEDSNNEVQGDFEFQPHSQNFDAVVDIQEQHLQAVGSMNSRESTTEILKGSHRKDPASEESTVGSSSQDKLEGSQMIVDPQQVLQENKVSLPLPVDPTVFSPSTSITTTSSSSTNQPPPSEEFVDFPGLFNIKETRAHLLEEAFVKYPHLWQWKLTQKTLRICKVGYKSLADMLAFLKSETPKTMNDSKMEKFENLYYEVEYFGFDKMWLASIHQRVMDMQADHNNKLKQLDHLKSQISNLEEQLSDAAATLASVKDDLSRPGHVFGF